MSGKDQDVAEAMARSCLRKCRKYIAALKEHPDAKPFKQPVDPVKDHAPGYYQVVKRPMDLRTITEKLREGRYWTPFEVDTDVNLMVDNCLAYNANVPLYCAKAQALLEQWGRLFWQDESLQADWATAASLLYQPVQEQEVAWQQGREGTAALERQLEAAGAEIVRASQWLEQPLTIRCGGRSARLLGGHHAAPPAVWTACECPACEGRPLSLAADGRLMTLQELHDHCTAAPPDAPALDTQQLMAAFTVTTPGAAGEPQGVLTLLDHLRARSEALGGPDLVGKDVCVFWCGGAGSWPPPATPQGGSWQAARIVCFDGVTGEHLLRYQNPEGPKARWLPCFRAYLPITFLHAGPHPPSANETPTLLPTHPAATPLAT